jgi:hypothetical protein
LGLPARIGEGGRFLRIPPGYDGPLPDSGCHVGHSQKASITAWLPRCWPCSARHHAQPVILPLAADAR